MKGQKVTTLIMLIPILMVESRAEFEKKITILIWYRYVFHSIIKVHSPGYNICVAGI